MATTYPNAGEKRNIVIIGGGIIGCTSAYYLSRHPSFDPAHHKITLLEASQIAGGASGKAGGLLALWAYPSSIVPLSFRLHAELAEEHGGAERWGYRRVHVGQVEGKGRAGVGSKREKAERRVEGNDAEMTGDGGKEEDGERVSLKKRDKAALAKLRAAGVPADLDWIDPEAEPLYEEMGDPSTTAQVHPFHFTTAMAELAKEKGVEIKTGCAVDKINYTADGNGVESVSYTSTSDGKQETLPATDIVLAAGPWTKNLLPTAPISALRAHSVTIRPSRPVSAYALFTQITLPGKNGRRGETATPEIYARPHNEVYACGEGDTLVPLPRPTGDVVVDEKRCQDVVDQVSAISEELREGEVTARQACYLPNVESRRAAGPLVGMTGVRGLVLAAGHTCWGIQNGPGTGKLVAEFVWEGSARSAKVGGLDPRQVL